MQGQGRAWFFHAAFLSMTIGLPGGGVIMRRLTTTYGRRVRPLRCFGGGVSFFTLFFLRSRSRVQRPQRAGVILAAVQARCNVAQSSFWSRVPDIAGGVRWCSPACEHGGPGGGAVTASAHAWGGAAALGGPRRWRWRRAGRWSGRVVDDGAS